MNQKCARGMLFPFNDVMIDNIDERYIGILVHVMTEEVGILEDAISTIIQWLRVIIVLSKTTSAQPSTAKVVMEKNMSKLKANKPRPIESLRGLLKTNLVVHVVADARQGRLIFQ
uniref:Uncharacterized protein n=1 Tax=Lactuca sativa TaxID=4236 RepID=A0A9R1WWS4_LACSA|nr:hypothetical protein LSAT_V11C800446600 [Lactuca sativa]